MSNDDAGSPKSRETFWGGKNAERFIGFADIYDKARPKMPLYPVEAIKRYLAREPEKVVDLGCGTGLSTLVWKGHCRDVIGIEPSGDMLAEAVKKQADNIAFKSGWGHDTGLPDGFADVVICSQSFHWMEPKSTLTEVNRILKPGGVFATVDCDWPPFCSLEADIAFEELFCIMAGIEQEYPQIGSIHKMWDKSRHIENIENSGYFRFAREIVFSNREACTAERFIKIAQSQGALQSILKRKPELIEKHFEAFKETVASSLGDGVFDIDFGYRMRIAVK